MSAVIGAIAGVLVIEAVFFVERKLKVDDPVGAIAVHGVNGTFGVLVRRPLRQRQLRRRLERLRTCEGVKGLFWGDGGQFVAQLLGVVVIWTVILGVAYAFFKIQDSHLEEDGQGRHPLRPRKTSSPGSTCRRWASSPTRSSSAATST